MDLSTARFFCFHNPYSNEQNCEKMPEFRYALLEVWGKQPHY